jgi:hypothetical protein
MRSCLILGRSIGRLPAKLVDKVRENWKFIAVLPLFLWLAVKIFLRVPALSIGLASVPVGEAIERRVGLSPVLSRIMGFVVTLALTVASWHVGEIIAILCAIALAREAVSLIAAIQKRMIEPKLQSA